MKFRFKKLSLSVDWPTWELSPLIEAAEYLATEDPSQTYFWNFLENIEEDKEKIGLIASSNSFKVRCIPFPLFRHDTHS